MPTGSSAAASASIRDRPSLAADLAQRVEGQAAHAVIDLGRGGDRLECVGRRLKLPEARQLESRTSRGQRSGPAPGA